MTTQSPTLRRILKGDLCTGCGLCQGLAPDAVSLRTASPGFTRPQQIGPVSEAAERAIASACPGAVVAPWTSASESDPYWGPVRDVMVGHARDASVRHAGSSGAAISALAAYALQTRLAQQVLHVVADPEHPTRNIIKLSAKAEDVVAGAGSRYAASSPLAAVGRLLDEGTPTVFIGKPCDVSALRLLGNNDPRIDAVFPLKLSFFCAGVPSHAGADRIVRAMGFDPTELIAFRYRGNGWPGMTRAETSDGRAAEMRYADSWGEHLSKEVQFRCKICPDGVGGAADITAADAWYGGESGYPDFDERDGRSLILSRTPLGERVLRDAIQGGAIHAEPLALREIDLMQPGQVRRKRALAARLLALRAAGQPLPRMSRLSIAAAARRSPAKETLRNFGGMLWRIARKRR